MTCPSGTITSASVKKQGNLVAVNMTLTVNFTANGTILIENYPEDAIPKNSGATFIPLFIRPTSYANQSVNMGAVLAFSTKKITANGTSSLSSATIALSGTYFV